MKISNMLDRSTKIQRYMDFSKFLHILESKQIFMCRIDKFEDKLEGGLTTINDFFYSGAAEALSNLVNNSLPLSLGRACNSPESIEEAQQRQQEYEDKSRNKSFTTVFGDIELSEEVTYKDVIKAQKQWFDVSCWHSNIDDTESIAMWKIYGNDTNSVCITTTIGQLLDSIEEDENVNLLIQKVEYIDHRADHYSLEVDSKLAPFVHKHKAYKFENEVRLIAYNHSNDPLNNRADAGSLIRLKSNDFINSVKVSPEAHEWFFNLVKDIFNDRYEQTGVVARSDLDDLVTELSS